MDQRQELLLAYGIAEYQSAIDHLHAMQAVGTHVPPDVIDRIRGEQTLLLRHWSVTHGISTWADQRHVVDLVRLWVTDHLTEMDALLREEGQNQ